MKFTRRGIQCAIKYYNHSRGVLKTSMHLYRNTFSRIFLRNGGSKDTLQNLLGHSTPQMVDRYAKLYGIDLKEISTQYNPINNFYVPSKIDMEKE